MYVRLKTVFSAGTPVVWDTRYTYMSIPSTLPKTRRAAAKTRWSPVPPPETPTTFAFSSPSRLAASHETPPIEAAPGGVLEAIFGGNFGGSGEG